MSDFAVTFMGMFRLPTPGTTPFSGFGFATSSRRGGHPSKLSAISVDNGWEIDEPVLHFSFLFPPFFFRIRR